MKLLDKFSLQTGLKKGKPYIQEDYISTNLDLTKTILISAGDDNSNFSSKLYPYYSDVIDYLSPVIKPLGYSFAQIGLNEPRLPNINSFQGCSPNQTAYLINRCAMVITNDNSNLQIAAHFNKKLIGLFGPTSPVNHGPEFGSKKNQVILTHDKKEWKYTYNANESPRSINTIKPERVAQHTLELLGICENIKFESVLIGANYPATALELIPNQVLPPQFQQNIPVTIRMDYEFNEQIMAQNLSTRKGTIITDQQINIDLLKQLKSNLQCVNYKIDLNSNLAYCKKLKDEGVKVVFFSDEDGENLNSLRFKMLDIGLVEEFKIEKKPLDCPASIGDNIFYKTNKFLLSQGKIYLSKYDWFMDCPVASFAQNISKVKDHPYFWQDSHFCYIFKQT